ncbi:MAG: TiaS agmantine-binding domain-containing protein [Acidilobus sp.]
MTEDRLITVAIDDTDSQYGGCTTHLTGILLSELRGKARLADYPLLVRLNPNIPWKTRGNAATALRLLYHGEPDEILELAWQLAQEYTTPRPPLPNKQPGVVVAEGPVWRSEALRSLYLQALTDVVTFDVALRALKSVSATFRGGRGVIGAAAALAALAPQDPYTFELTFYRLPENWGTDRCVDFTKAFSVDSRTQAAFNNLDLEDRVVTAAPGGPDPVLAGFRGLDPDELWAYSEALCERPHFAVLFKSNQHTGVHLRPGRPAPYRSILVRGIISSTPRSLPGGHAVVTVRTEFGDLDVVAFRETGPLVDALKMLRPGDEVEVGGGVRPYSPAGRVTIAVELMRVLKVSRQTLRVPPRCPVDGSTMESVGRGKGYRCPRCGLRLPEDAAIHVEIPRPLMPGLYLPKEGRLRHLTPEGRPLPVSNALAEGLEVPDVLRVFSNPYEPPG